MLERLEKLCNLNGISGREHSVREYIISQIEGKAEYTVDPLGNVLVFKKGKNTAKNRVMLTAHMDEVGFMVTEITSSGCLKIAAVGGIDEKVVAGRLVTVNGIEGVIGLKPVHLCDDDEMKKSPEIKALCVDIGADSKEEAQKLVSIGDSVCFASDFVKFGNNRIKAKAIDDRFGCAVMLDMIDGELEYDTWFAFLVQEEVGLRGAQPAAYTIRPDYAIVIETTTASDIAFVSGADRVCLVGGGAVVSFMDRSTVYDRQLFKKAFALAEENGIKCQTKTVVAGGNDAGAIHKSAGGIKTLAVSLPCRYLHSASSVAGVDDMQSVKELVGVLAKEFAVC